MRQNPLLVHHVGASMRAPLILAALLVAAAPCPAQTTRYVTDTLRLEARNGPSVQNRILRMLETGTEVQVLEDSEGWSRVRVPGGDEVWILTRYLTEEPPARGRLQAAMADLQSARAEIDRLNAELSELRSQHAALIESRDALQATADDIAAELAAIKRTASNAIALQEENRVVTSRFAELQARMELLQQQYVTLRHARSRDWFLAGAGVLLGGLVLGLIIPKIRWRRRRSWSEL